jgi:hypothetical protein
MTMAISIEIFRLGFRNTQVLGIILAVVAEKGSQRGRQQEWASLLCLPLLPAL